MENSFSWHVVTGLARIIAKTRYPMCECVNRENKILNDISILFLYLWFSRAMSCTRYRSLWQLEVQRPYKICGVRRGGTVTSFYFSEGVKKRGSLSLLLPQTLIPAFQDAKRLNVEKHGEAAKLKLKFTDIQILMAAIVLSGSLVKGSLDISCERQALCQRP